VTVDSKRRCEVLVDHYLEESTNARRREKVIAVLGYSGEATILVWATVEHAGTWWHLQHLNMRNFSCSFFQRVVTIIIDFNSGISL
jgi:hypothetical protein